MGIKQLYKLIADYAPDAVETRALSELGDRRVVIDLFLYLHRFNATQGNCFTGLFHQIMLLKDNRITPIYIIDGDCTELKRTTVNQRKKAISKHVQKLKDAENANESKETLFKLKNLTYRVDEKEIDFCKTLFDHLGVPWIQATGEADILMASMVKDGKADACLTEDADALTFGCPLLWRKFKGGKVDVYRLSTVLKRFRLDLDKFRQLCILSGCDYTTTVKGIGPKTALTLLRTHKDIDEIIATRKSPPGAYEWRGAMQIFQSEAKTRRRKFVFGKPQIHALIPFLAKTLRLSDNRLENIKKRLYSLDAV